MKSYCQLFLIIILCTNCSWTKNRFGNKDKKKKHRKKIIENFNVDESVLKKFEEKSVEKEEKIVVPDNSENNSMKSDPKVIVKNKITKESSIKPAVAKKPIIVKSIYPTSKKYPKKYKELDNLSKVFWPNFTPRIYTGEKTFLDITYMGVTAGKIKIEVMDKINIGGKNAYHLNTTLKSAPFYRYVYELDDNIDSFLSVEHFSPLKFSLIQRESKQSVDDLQLFDRDHLKTYTFYQRVTDDGTKKKKQDKFTPYYYQDPLSVIFFLRGMPLKVGDKYNIPIMNEGKVLIFKTEVVKNENVETYSGEVNAIKVKIESKYSGDTIKSGDMAFWFSADKTRRFLKFKAKISLGSVYGELTKYEEN